MPQQSPSPLLAFLRRLLGQSRTQAPRPPAAPAAAVVAAPEAPRFPSQDSV